MKAIIIWGNQLSIEQHSALQSEPDAPIIIIESKGMCTKYRFHKQKLRFVLTAMRDYADELEAGGRRVWYSQLEDSADNWFDQLQTVCKKRQVTELLVMRASDRGPQQKLEQWCRQHGIKLETTANTLFLTPTSLFNEWAETQKRLHMEMFYRWQRKRLDILMVNDKPLGGTWNYDAENRKPLPKHIDIPRITQQQSSPHVISIENIITTYFDNNPGTLEINWLPTTRVAARSWLRDFIQTRFTNFGAYEDAMHQDETFLFHSGMSALLNIGLLHPQEVIDAALQAEGIPRASLEGFVRQIIGWREFMFGLYHYLPADWIDSNYLNHQQQLPDWWWQLDGAPEPPLQRCMERLRAYGYNHHIERLIVFGNYMLLAGYHPCQIHDWFMTMYVDAYEWVMTPNVIGMSQYADGGMDNGGFATKPYISGSNYLQKMGSWWPTGKAAKESDWTDMYWDFLQRHETLLRTNHRLRPLYSSKRLKS